ncbi:hypothetical protein GCM10020331_059100 [Ectobacillus funiculus]
MDRLPNILHIKDGLGLTVYVCPDCDGYEVQHKCVLVLGAGKTGAEMSLALTYWTKDIVYINHDGTPIEDELQKKKLHAAEISYINEKNRGSSYRRWLVLSRRSITKRKDCKR